MVTNDFYGIQLWPQIRENMVARNLVTNLFIKVGTRGGNEDIFTVVVKLQTTT